MKVTDETTELKKRRQQQAMSFTPDPLSAAGRASLASPVGGYFGIGGGGRLP